jgi:uncharacterized membrane protein
MDSFNSFWNNVYATPFHYVEMFFAFLAVFAFLIYFRGFLGSVGNIFKMNGHDEHVEHAQVRQMWGMLLLIMVFVVWEIARTIASWLGFNDGYNNNLGYWFVGIIVVVWLYRFIKKNLFSGGGGH